MYGKPDYMLVPNPAGRYTVGSQSDLVTADDGSITLTFAPELPDGTPEANWLPTPAGKAFTADLRLYLPRDAVRQGQWSPPALTRNLTPVAGEKSASRKSSMGRTL